MKWIKNKFLGLLFSFSVIDKKLLSQNSISDANDTNLIIEKDQGTLLHGLRNQIINEEVKKLRWRMFKVLEASDKMLISSLSVDEEGYHTLDVKKVDPVAMQVRLRKVKIDDFDDYPLEMVIDNKDITLGGMDAINDEMKIYDLVERKANVKEVSGVTTTTLGIIDSESYHSSIKGEKPVKVIRDLRPKFEIEKYTKKLNVRKINETERLLEFYVSIYPDEYDRTSRMFLSELKRVIKNPRISDMIEINSVGFTTYKSIGVKDFHQYQYKITGFDKIVEFNGHYIIKFKADVIVNGEYLLEKYRLKELDEKYTKKESKY